MADDKNADNAKPSINVTRGKKKPPRARKTSGSKKDSSSWLPFGLDESAREMWLAGLGALSVVEDQGAKLYRALVQEGKNWEKARREETEAALKEVEAQTEETLEAAQETVDEQVVRRVREGVDAALDRAGVPTRAAMDDLRQQVNELAKKTDRLAEQLEEQQLQERGDGRAS